MSKKRYCAFWFPTIFHQTGLNVFNSRHSVTGIDISDYVKKSSFRLFLDVNEDKNGNIVFSTYTKSTDSKPIDSKVILRLQRESFSNNGFAVYSYEDEKVDFKDYLFSSVLYHHAKSLHHNHEVKHDSDSGLTAISDSDISFLPYDIFRQNNVILLQYIKQYEILFAEHYAYILSEKSRFYDKVISAFEAFRKYRTREKLLTLDDYQFRKLTNAVITLFKEVCSVNSELLGGSDKHLEIKNRCQCKKAIKRLMDQQAPICQFLVQDILKICNNALIEYTYCKTLLKSKYNTAVKHNLSFDKCEIFDIFYSKNHGQEELLQKDISRKRANNIRNSMRYIECIKDKCSQRTYELTDAMLTEADRMGRKANVLAWLFGTCTAIGLLLSIISLCRCF